MDPIESVSELFAAHIEEVSATAVAVAEPLCDTSEIMVHALLSDHKILCAGCGPQNAVAQLFSAHLVNQFARERPGLPAIALSSDSCLLNTLCETGQYADSIARQVNTLGNRGDVLMLLAGSSTNSLTRAIAAAHDRELTVVLFHDNNQPDAAALLGRQDIEIALPTSTAARLIEANVVLINCLCELIDQYLFGGDAI